MTLIGTGKVQKEILRVLRESGKDAPLGFISQKIRGDCNSNASLRTILSTMVKLRLIDRVAFGVYKERSI